MFHAPKHWLAKQCYMQASGIHMGVSIYKVNGQRD